MASNKQPAIVEIVQPNGDDDFFSLQPVALQDDFTDMPNKQWAKLCTKYIGDLMQEVLVSESEHTSPVHQRAL